MRNHAQNRDFPHQTDIHSALQSSEVGRSRLRAIAVLSGFGCVTWGLTHFGNSQRSDAYDLDGRIPVFQTDLNSAPVHELDLLPGIGPKMVQDIDRYRKQHGRFQSPTELDEVPGIGAIRLEQVEPSITIQPHREPSDLLKK